MSSSRTDQDVRTPASSARSNESIGRDDGGLSPVQVLAGALAAVSAAVIASLFGVAGTVIGAAVASVVSTVGAAVYSSSLRRAHRRLIRPAGAAGVRPLPAWLNPRRPPARRWRRRWILAATAVGVFVLAMGVVTVVELIGREPVFALVGGSGHSGGTTIGTLTEGIGGGSPGQTPASSGAGNAVPSRASGPPASGSAPAGTSSRESAAADGSASIVPAPSSSAADQTASTRTAAPTQAAQASDTAASTAPVTSTAAPPSPPLVSASPRQPSDTGAAQPSSAAVPSP
jgi:hypothetical protein